MTWLLVDDDDDSESTAASDSSYSAPPTSEYTDTTTDDYDTTSEYTTEYEPPETTTTTYEPPPEYWGAIAVGDKGGYGYVYDTHSRSSAKSEAIRHCKQHDYGCEVLVTMVNECGALVENSSNTEFWGGTGDTAKEAAADAKSNAGGGRTIRTVCTTRP